MAGKSRIKDVTRVSLILPGDMKSEVERIAAKRDATQQQVYRMLLDLGIEVHKDMERVGIIKAVDFAYYVKKAVKEKIEGSGSRQTTII